MNYIKLSSMNRCFSDLQKQNTCSMHTFTHAADPRFAAYYSTIQILADLRLFISIGFSAIWGELNNPLDLVEFQSVRRRRLNVAAQIGFGWMEPNEVTPANDF